MALPKGNAVALMPLRPDELKVGDLYMGIVDNLIKRNDAAQAAKAKLLADQHKMIGERFKDIKIDAFETTSQLTDSAIKMYKDTYDFVAEQRMKADADPTNAYKYLALADRAKSNYLSLSTTLGSKNFIERSNAKQAAIASGEAFANSDDIEQWTLMSKGMYKPMFNRETGEWLFAVPKNANAVDGDKAELITAGQLVDRFTSSPEIDLLNDNKANGNNGFFNQMEKESKNFADEWSKNTDGNRTTGYSGFARPRAESWFKTTFGEYNADYINPRIVQYSKNVLKKSISNENDYNEARKSIVDRIAAYVPTDTEIDTRKTSTELALDQARLQGEYLDNQKKKLDIKKAIKELANPDSATDEDGLIIGGTMLRISDPKRQGTVGYYNQGGITLKGAMGSGTNAKEVFVTTYWNPNGNNKKGSVAFGLSLPSTDGRGMTTIPLGSQSDKNGLTTARKYLSNSDFDKLKKAALLISKNPQLQKSGQIENNIPMSFRNVDFSEFLGTKKPATTTIKTFEQTIK